MPFHYPCPISISNIHIPSFCIVFSMIFERMTKPMLGCCLFVGFTDFVLDIATVIGCWWCYWIFKLLLVSVDMGIWYWYRIFILDIYIGLWYWHRTFILDIDLNVDIGWWVWILDMDIGYWYTTWVLKWHSHIRYWYRILELPLYRNNAVG